jgi:hypothetical protein
MQPAELIEMANTLLSMHRDALIIDHFVKISIEISDGDFVSECIKDSAAFSWRLKLNPSRHNDLIDVQYSIVDGLLTIMFDDFSLIEHNSNMIIEYKKRLISRLTAAICRMMDFSETEEEQHNDEG